MNSKAWHNVCLATGRLRRPCLSALPALKILPHHLIVALTEAFCRRLARAPAQAKLIPAVYFLSSSVTDHIDNGMPKGVNEKAQAARDRKASQKEEVNKAKAKAAEDAYWQSAGEGSKTKAQAKKEEQERQRAESAAKKLEAKRLAEAEEAALVKPKADKKAARVTGKVTHYELHQQKEADAVASEAQARERELAARREVTEDSYSRLVDMENTNRAADMVEARGMEQAIDALASLSTESPAADKHPEKRMRAAWKAFEERQLPLLRMEKPNLKQSQYRDMLWRMWQKSPENPINQAAAGGGSR